MKQATWYVLTPSKEHADMARMWFVGACAKYPGQLSVTTDGAEVHLAGDSEVVKQVVANFRIWLDSLEIALVSISDQTGDA